MIDNPEQVGWLIPRIKESLPLPATLTPELAASLREQSPQIDIPQHCCITRIDYLGDEGGIMCRLDLRNKSDSKVFFVSITHLIPLP